MPAFSPRYLLLCALTATAALHAQARAHEAATPGGRTGTIEGEVRIAPAPPRRTATRYATALPAPQKTVQPAPVLVYLKGPVPGARTPAAARATLGQRDTLFTPAGIVVRVGTRVEFPNHDPFFHNVFSYSSAKRFDLGRYPRGESKSVVFDEPGVVKVYCEVHESMRALIIVIEHEHHAIVGDDGRFTITDVPPGRYELVVEDADRGTRSVDVTVQTGRVTRPTVRF